MGVAAVMAAKSLITWGQARSSFYLLKTASSIWEMNTRIQVEHPVTEMITGLDLVAEQIQIAQGEKLQLTQDQVVLRGHAIECRINAEDPEHNFRPAAGGSGSAARRSRCNGPTFTPIIKFPYYDSLIGKLIVWGPDRPTAINRMKRALRECALTGVPTTIGFIKDPGDTGVFGEVYTNFVEQVMLSTALIQVRNHGQQSLLTQKQLQVS